MTWPMPASGQWNPNVAMTSNMNLGYTPDQWTLMQQQNWQQWAQWQQQYTQWHAQYGEKYAEQMQTVQAVGVVPPLPPMNSLPPPAPPPPKEPPPPHQNDQPLYAHQKPPPPPVPAPYQSSSKSDNINYIHTPENNILNWSFATEPHSFSQNSDALKKLSEEERLFDIQFQKWEEEIEKWKKENVNHPDKQAYSEYEQKFEACRAQLLERRQVMKQKRAMLMSNNSQNSNIASMEKRSSVSTSLQNANMNSYASNDSQTQNLNNVLSSNYSQQNLTQYQQYNITDQTNYTNDNDYLQVDMQYNKSHENADAYQTPREKSSNFLPTKETTNGIPGLDLVPEVEKISSLNKTDIVIDITLDNMEENQGMALQCPDYSTISKGINNILGDEKIMNILTMVRQKSNSSVNSIQLQNNMNPINAQQYHNNAVFCNRQNVPYNVKESVKILRTDNEQFTQRQYDPSQNIACNEKFYGNYYVQNSSQEMLPKNQLTPRQVRPSFQNQPIQTNFDNYQRVSHDERNIAGHETHSMTIQPARSKWVDQPLFTPSIIVEYEHKPLRLKARDFIEPVHMFDYNHKSKQSDNKKKDFEREVDDLFLRQPLVKDMNNEDFPRERLYRESYYRDYERKPRDNNREDYRQRLPSREGYDERHRHDVRHDDSDKYRRREDIYRDRDKGRDREEYKDRYKDYRRDEIRNRSRSKEKENRKREHSKENEVGGSYPFKKGKEASENSALLKAKHIVMIDDLLELPGREMRPEKIVIILRGLPGSGKSYLAKLIRDKEAEHGGTVRIMSIDDYFMQEGETEVNDPVTGKVVKKPLLKYEFDQDLEESYMNSLKRAFKRSLTDGYFTFLIFDAVNDHLKSYADIWNFARQNGFQVYICTMEADPTMCHKRNIHNRTLEDINKIHHTFFPTPEHHIQLDATTLLQNAAIPEVQMEDADDEVTMEDVAETEVENHFTSKWEKMDDAAQLARLDGTSKPLRPSQLSMEDYLQIDDWKPSVAKPGKKTVRWADIEERRQQEKMRAIGFVVGQTDWNRMTDPTMGSGALTQTMYIERVRKT